MTFFHVDVVLPLACQRYNKHNNSFYVEAPFNAPKDTLQFIKYSKERFKTVQEDYNREHVGKQETCTVALQ